ncbi:diaminopimelate decarboxylase [Rhodohalobacter barkolensis]|uniref:Diaminopimelate decarboxylase n=1 Tax=Rhodohalobacter barkolensis TaxID=2053187 RepID=A0A2N0VE08_9BACT|nr:diaminopimelate decarboxylase [Rhodohalobacter barkolensis]PKD42429.1 diaminopimelate decarboxylase [Rhodohalobacter barkolensis]
MFDAQTIKSFKSQKTPFYYYDLGLLRRTLDEIKNHGLSKGYHVHFAIKANFNLPILEEVRKAGLGIDCVSGNEIKRAVEAGFTGDQLAFAGVGKTDEEIQVGLDHDIFSFNCESLQELEILNGLAQKSGKTANVSIRLNPNVEAKTHRYITTGLNENKFGITADRLPKLFDMLPGLKNISLTGIHFHIGSQITDLQPFTDLCNRVNEMQDLFEENGVRLDHINVGGGYGIDYEKVDENPIPDFKSFFEVFDRNLELREGQQVHFELGRSIVGQCGSLISKVLYIKEGATTNFAVVDAGMTELIRPALYQANHRVDVLTSDKPHKTYDVVGPICETSDTFQKGIQLPEIERGDLVAIRSAGAYGEVMSSAYNLRDRVKAVYSK